MPIYDNEMKKKLETLASTVPGSTTREKWVNLVRAMRLQTNYVYNYNRRPYQGRAVVGEIFNLAREDKLPIRLFLGDVSCGYYGDTTLLSELRSLADRGNEVTVVLAEKPDSSDLNAWIKLSRYEKVRVLHKDKYDEDLSHVCIAGSLTDSHAAYRLEAPHKKLSKHEKVTSESPERPAKFAFNAPTDVGGIMHYWDSTVISNCKNLEA